MRTRCRVARPIVWIAMVTMALHAQERTEQELVELIIRDGPQARAIRAATDVVTAEQTARVTFPNPVASYLREGAGLTQFAQVEQPLPAFGLRGALERAGVAAREAAEAEREARLWQLRADAHIALARLRNASERLQAADAVVRSIDRLIAVLRTREQEGEGSRFDRVRGEQELVEVRQLAVEAAIERAEAKRTLAALLPSGISPPDRLAPYVPPQAVDALDALTLRATTSRAELRALERAAVRFSLEAEAARRATGPALAITGGVKRAGDGSATRTGGVFGAGVTLPLFNRGTREAAFWSAERLRVEFERAALEAEIRAQIVRAAEAVSLRHQHSQVVTASLTSADELVSIADVAYREGDIGILQLLDAYRTAGRARERAIESKLQLRLAQIALERAVGVTLWP
jgi:cobalt-zinc-cadmium efflux system outer membrane protein